jgi:predicted amidohydrolase YtcJ
MTSPSQAGAADPAARDEHADLILTDADVWCGDAAHSWGRAIAIRGDRLAAVGSDDDVRAVRGPRTEVVSLPGRAIVPGFQDAHVHPAFGARNLLNVNLDDLTTRDEYLARIGAFAAANPDLDWIVGGGWYGPLFEAAGGPRREDLDAIAPDRAVFLMNNDVHAAWMSSRGLAEAGITADSSDPWDGYAVRDPDGTPTGTVQEGAAYDVLRTVVTPPDTGQWKAYLRRAQRELHALGITGWQDAWVEPGVLQAYRELDDEGDLTMRVVTALWWDRHRGMEQIDTFEEQRAWATGGNVHPIAIKLMLDGCPESCTGAMLAPYEPPFDQTHGTGIQFVAPGLLHQAAAALDARGFQLHQHALGDRAVRSALDAVEVAQRANGANDLRHHLAHLQLPDPADLPRLRRLRVVANLQPYWSQPDPGIERFTIPRVGATRAARLYPIGDLHRGGAVLAFGSDWPVSTPNPWLEIEVAVTRQVPGDPDSPPLDASQRIDLGAAIAAFARGSAYVNHDDDAGALAPGLRADLAVLDRNPFDRTRGAIGETRVEMTIARGAVVYDASRDEPSAYAR